jgi:hypothetical protein
MSRRTDYTDEEWNAIRRAPAEVVIAVEQSSPSGWYGRRSERKAATKGFAGVIEQFGSLELIADIVAERDAEAPLIDSLREGGESLIEAAIDDAAAAPGQSSGTARARNRRPSRVRSCGWPRRSRARLASAASNRT